MAHTTFCMILVSLFLRKVLIHLILGRQVQKHRSNTLKMYLDISRINSTTVTTGVLNINLNQGSNSVCWLKTANQRAVVNQRINLHNCCTTLPFLSKSATKSVLPSQSEAVQAPQRALLHFLFDLLRAQISAHLFYSLQAEQQPEGWEMQQNIQDLHSTNASSCLCLLSSTVVSRSRVEHLQYLATQL